MRNETIFKAHNLGKITLKKSLYIKRTEVHFFLLSVGGRIIGITRACLRLYGAISHSHEEQKRGREGGIIGYFFLN